MNEDLVQLLKDYVATVNSGKYAGWDEVDQIFADTEISTIDKQLLKDYVATVNSGKYKGWDDVNTKFQEYIGKPLKKKDIAGESQQPSLESSGVPSQESVGTAEGESSDSVFGKVFDWVKSTLSTAGQVQAKTAEGMAPMRIKSPEEQVEEKKSEMDKIAEKYTIDQQKNPSKFFLQYQKDNGVSESMVTKGGMIPADIDFLDLYEKEQEAYKLFEKERIESSQLTGTPFDKNKSKEYWEYYKKFGEAGRNTISNPSQNEWVNQYQLIKKRISDADNPRMLEYLSKVRGFNSDVLSSRWNKLKSDSKFIEALGTIQSTKLGLESEEWKSQPETQEKKQMQDQAIQNVAQLEQQYANQLSEYNSILQIDERNKKFYNVAMNYFPNAVANNMEAKRRREFIDKQYENGWVNIDPKSLMLGPNPLSILGKGWMWDFETMSDKGIEIPSWMHQTMVSAKRAGANIVGYLLKSPETIKNLALALPSASGAEINYNWTNRLADWVDDNINDNPAIGTLPESVFDLPDGQKFFAKNDFRKGLVEFKDRADIKIKSEGVVDLGPNLIVGDNVSGVVEREDENGIEILLDNGNTEYIKNDNIESINRKPASEFDVEWSRLPSAGTTAIIDMIALIFGGRAISKGIGVVSGTVGATVSEAAASNAGLISASYLITAPEYYKRAIDAGIPNPEAFASASATITSAIELISPNRAIAGALNRTSYEGFTRVFRESLMSGKTAKASLADGATFLAKQVGLENVQEISQGLADLGLEYTMNEMYDREMFDVSKQRVIAEGVETVLLTTLATSVVSSPSAFKMSKAVVPYHDAVDMVARNQDKYMPMVNQMINDSQADPVTANRIKNDIAERVGLLNKFKDTAGYWDRKNKKELTKEDAMDAILSGRYNEIEVFNDNDVVKAKNVAMAYDMDRDKLGRAAANNSSINTLLMRGGKLFLGSVNGQEVNKVGSINTENGSVKFVTADQTYDLGNVEDVGNKIGSDLNLSDLNDQQHIDLASDYIANGSKKLQGSVSDQFKEMLKDMVGMGLATEKDGKIELKPQAAKVINFSSELFDSNKTADKLNIATRRGIATELTNEVADDLSKNGANKIIRQLAKATTLMKKSTGGIIKNPRYVMLNNDEEATILARSMGKRVRAGYTVNGWYDRGSNTMFFIADKKTAIHEAVMHPVLDAIQNLAPDSYNRFLSDIEAIRNEATGDRYVQESEKAGYAPTKQRMEAAVSFLTDVSSGRIFDQNIVKKTYDKILEFLNDWLGDSKFFNNLGISKKAQVDVSDAATIRDIASSIATAIARGQEIEIVGAKSGKRKRNVANKSKKKKEIEISSNLRSVFDKTTDFGGKLSKPAVLSKYTEKNGIGYAEYTNPDSGVVDVYLAAFGENDYLGYIRVYENGKPTNRFTSKLERRTDKSGATKQMISELQNMLPKNHEYAEDISITMDGLKWFRNQLKNGYELLRDENGNVVTTNVGLGSGVGGFETLPIKNKEEFDKIKKSISEELESLGIENPNIVWQTSGGNMTAVFDLPVLRKLDTTTELSQQQRGNNIAGTLYAEHMTSDGSGNYVFFHVSGADQKDLNKGIDSRKFYSTRTSRDEKALQYGIASYYTKPTDGEAMVLGQTYFVKVPASKVYPMNTDPNGYESIADASFPKNEPFRYEKVRQEMARLAKDAGFEMTVGYWGLNEKTGSVRRGMNALRADALVPLKPKLYEEEKQSFVVGEDTDLSQQKRKTKRSQAELKSDAEAFINRVTNKFPEAVVPEVVKSKGRIAVDQNGFIKYVIQPYELLNGAKELVSENVDEAVDILSNRIADDYNNNKDRSEISNGIGWYSKMRDWFQKNFGANIEMFGQLLAATSAQTEVIQNFNNTIEAMTNYSRGMYDDLLNRYDQYVQSIASMSDQDLLAKYNEWYEGERTEKQFEKEKGEFRAKLVNDFEEQPLKTNGKKFNANGPKVLQALYGNWLQQTKGPKTKNFAGNLTGRSLSPTIDIWAARYLRRIIYGNQQRWRIVPELETGVQFNELVSGELSGDYPFAERVMQSAADKLGMNADDLQAFLWYLEKDTWDKNGWTENKAAKRKASFEEGAATLEAERYQMGVTTVRDPNNYSKEEFENARKEIRSTIGSLDGIIIQRATSSEGVYMGSAEPSFDVEFTVRKGTDVTPILNKLEEIGRRFNQDSVLFTKVVDSTDQNAMPMIEIGLKKPSKESALINRVIDLFSRNGIAGSTIARDKMGNILGVRAQFVPEFEDLSGGELALWDKHGKFVDAANTVKEAIKNDPEISYIENGFASTQVIFTRNEVQQGTTQEGNGVRPVEGMAQEETGSGQGNLQGEDLTGAAGTNAPSIEGTQQGGLGTAAQQVQGLDNTDLSQGQRRLAPNGKPSNLNEAQWNQVRTPEFKAWFGDWENDPENASKVLDANGEPLVMYHGTSGRFNYKTAEAEDTDISIFNSKKSGKSISPFRDTYSFFTWNPAFADYFSSVSGGRGRTVYPVFLNVRNAIDSSNLTAEQEQYYLEKLKETGENNQNNALSPESILEDLKNTRVNWQSVETIAFDKLTDKFNKDGVVLFENNQWTLAVKNPNQIKSAIGNNGQFSTTDNRISFSQQRRGDRPKITRTSKRVAGVGDINSAINKTLTDMYNQDPMNPVFTGTTQSINQALKDWNGLSARDMYAAIDQFGGDKLLNYVKDNRGNRNMSVLLLIEVFKKASAVNDNDLAISAFNELNKIGSSSGQLLRQMRELQAAMLDPNAPREVRITVNRNIVTKVINAEIDGSGTVLTSEQRAELDNLIDEYVASVANEHDTNKKYTKLKKSPNASKKDIKDAKKAREKSEKKANEAYGDIVAWASGNIVVDTGRAAGNLLQGLLLTVKSHWANFISSVLNTAEVIPSLAGPAIRSMLRMAGADIKGSGIVDSVSAIQLSGRTAIHRIIPSIIEAFSRGGMRSRNIEKFETGRQIMPWTAMKQIYRTASNEIASPLYKMITGRNLEKYTKDIIPKAIKKKDDGTLVEYTPMDLVMYKMFEGSTGWVALNMFRGLYISDRIFGDAARVFAAAKVMAEIETVKTVKLPSGEEQEIKIRGNTPWKMEDVQDFMYNMTPAQAEMVDRYARIFLYSDTESLFAKGGRELSLWLSRRADNLERDWGVDNKEIRKAASLLRFMGTTLVPYSTVPSNMAAHMMEIAIPIIPAIGSVYYYKKGDNNIGDMLIGRALLGSAFYTVGLSLLAFVTAGEPDDKNKDYVLKQELGGSRTFNKSKFLRWAFGGEDIDEPFQTDDEIISLQRYGVFGAFLNYMGSLKESLIDKGLWEEDMIMSMANAPLDVITSSLGSSAKAVIDMSVFHQQSMMLQAIKESGSDKKNPMSKFVTGTIETGSNLVWPNQISQWTQAYEAKTGEQPFVLRAENEKFLPMLKERMAKRNFPFIEAPSTLYPVLNVWGRPVEITYDEIMDLDNTKFVRDEAVIEISRLMKALNAKSPINLSSTSVDIDDVRYTLDETDIHTLEWIAGNMREGYVKELIFGNPDYALAEDSEKYKAIQDRASKANSSAQRLFKSYLLESMDSGNLTLDPITKKITWEQERAEPQQTAEELVGRM